MRPSPSTPSCALLLALSLSACSPTPLPATRPIERTPTVTTATPTPTPKPTLIPSPTPTQDPNLPCGANFPNGSFSFLNCDDIRRIREALGPRPLVNPGYARLKAAVDEYRASFPTTYNPNASWRGLWWGAGNHIARDMALVYLIQGDAAYARDIIRLINLVRDNTPVCTHLCGYYDPAPGGLESSGGLLSSTANHVVFQSLLFSYLAVRDTGLLAATLRSEYDAFFQHQAQLLEEAAIHDHNFTALTSWINRNAVAGSNMAALTIAASFPEEPRMRALQGRVRARLEWQFENWWEGDGGWGENSEQYGFKVLEEALLLAETLRKTASDDLYAKTFGRNSLHAMCSFYLKTATPEGTTPSLNDTGHYFIDPGLFELCGFRTGDPNLYFATDFYSWGVRHAYGVDAYDFQTPFHSIAWLGLRERDPATPEVTSLVLPDTGAAILRSDWSHEAQYMLLQYTSSKVHNEWSYGTLYFFDDGPWMTGNGYQAGPATPTDQHSTLGMDGASQTNTGGLSYHSPTSPALRQPPPSHKATPTSATHALCSG